MSEDPIGFADGTNSYLYVYNNPPTTVDPEGLRWEKIGKSHWKASADGDNLIALAMQTSGVERDWVCIWPLGPPSDWEDYPTAKACARASTVNLDATA